MQCNTVTSAIWEMIPITQEADVLISEEDAANPGQEETFPNIKNPAKADRSRVELGNL